MDSTPLRVCHNQRILIHKTFKGLAEHGKCSTGWFFGFKLHLIVNDKGKILNFKFTPGNVDDREPLKQKRFRQNIKGKLCADNGYIGQTLFEDLFLDSIQLITKMKNNIRNFLMSVADKIMLKKLALIETVNDELKNIAQIKHSEHYSFNNFIANTRSAKPGNQESTPHAGLPIPPPEMCAIFTRDRLGPGQRWRTSRPDTEPIFSAPVRTADLQRIRECISTSRQILLSSQKIKTRHQKTIYL